MTKFEFDVAMNSINLKYESARQEMQSVINSISAEKNKFEEQILDCKMRIRNVRENMDSLRVNYLAQKSELLGRYENTEA